MAQIGSRLIDATAAKITEDFFKAFETRLRPAVPVAAEASSTEPVAEAAAPDGSIGKLWWLIAALVVIAIAYFAIR